MTNDKLADEIEGRLPVWVLDKDGTWQETFTSVQWRQIIAALRRKPERNQCDGCARNLHLGKNGIHYELDGTPVMGCTAHLYERQPSSDKVLRVVQIVVQLEYDHWLRNGSAIKVEDAPLVLLDVQHALAAAEAEGKS